MTGKRHTFKALGIPTPQGSARAFVRGKRAVVTSDNKNLAAWRQAVRYEAQRYVEQHDLEMYDRKHYAIYLELRFVFTKPASASKRLRLHNKRPDLDKLVRAVGDALTGVIMEDDAMVDRLAAWKTYGDRTMSPGVWITFEAYNIKEG